MEKAAQYAGDLKQFLNGYKYQPRLTPRLDGLGGADLTPELVDQIVLWKLNRYVSLDSALLGRLNQLKALRMGEHRKGEPVLSELLATHGVDLPMASTLLRFRNPGVFQIIDRHAYRAVYGAPYPLFASTPASSKVAVYFEYLDDLLSFCQGRQLAFSTIDRLLYMFDKELNGRLKGEEP